MSLISDKPTNAELQHLSEIRGTAKENSVYESKDWAENIYCLSETDYVEGGPSGIDNRQAKQLASRTQYLKAELESLQTRQNQMAASASEELTTTVIDGIKVGQDHTTQRYVYCNTSSSSHTKAVSVDKFELTSGASLYVHFANTNTAVPTSSTPIALEVNNTGAIPIYYNGGPLNIPGFIKANRVLHVVLDLMKGAWMIIGEVENPNNMRVAVTGAGTADAVALAHGSTANLVLKTLDVSKVDRGVLSIENGGTGNQHGKANALASRVSLSGTLFDGSKDSHNYFVCSTAAGTVAKKAYLYGEATNTEAFKLQPGAIAHVLFKNTNTAKHASIKLNIHNTGDKGIRYAGDVLPSSIVLTSGCVYSFIYDGTFWTLAGEHGSAKQSHASTSGVNGIGDESNYGHLRLTDTLSEVYDSTKGIAATPNMVLRALNTAKGYTDSFLSKDGGTVTGAIFVDGNLSVRSDDTAKIAATKGVSTAQFAIEVIPSDRYTGTTAVQDLPSTRLSPFKIISSKNSSATIPGIIVSSDGGALMLSSGTGHLYAKSANISGDNKNMYLVSDKELRIVVNHGGTANILVVTKDLSVHPETNNAGSLGTSSKRWGSVYGKNINLSGSATIAGSATISGTVKAAAGMTVTGSTTLTGNLTLSSTGNILTIPTKNAKNATTLLSPVALCLNIPKASINNNAPDFVKRYPFHVIGIKEDSNDIQPGFAITGNSGALVLSGGDAMARVMDDIDVVGQSECVVVAADSSIYFGTNYGSAQSGGTNQRVAILDKSLNFYPKINSGGNLGTTNNRWHNLYANAVNTVSTVISGNYVQGTHFNAKRETLTKNSTPENDEYLSVARFVDKDNELLSNLGYRRLKDGSIRSYIACVHKEKSGSSISIGCGFDKAGNWETYAPTPATTDKSSKIATTTYVQNYVATQITPAGMLMPYAGNGTLPSGWLLCNGAPVSRTTYAKLFSVIGTTYGTGNGTTTFNLPDLRGRFVEGTEGKHEYVKPGLPNITGQFNADDSQVGNTLHSSNNLAAPAGSFYKVKNISMDFDSDSGHTGGVLGFSAARSSEIYGNSTTVQPAALRVRWLIKY